MKHQTLGKLLICMISLLLVCASCLSAFAETAADSEEFTIEKKTLVKYNGLGGEVTVPEGVEVLGEWAFEDARVTKVNLPETLKEIKNYCFYGCEGLSDITLPASLRKISEAQAFAYNRSLKEIKVAEGNRQFKSVDGVLFTANGQKLLYYPDGKSGAYEIPEGTRQLGYTAFGKPEMTSVTIPATLGKLSGTDFSLIPALKEIKISEKHRTYHMVGGAMYDRGRNLIAYACGDEKEELKPEDFEEKTGKIENWAFQGNQHLKKVEFPEGVKKIGWMCFTWADALEEVIVPASVKTIEQYAFAHCPNLKKVTILNPWVTMPRDQRNQDPLKENIFRYSNEDAVLCGPANSNVQKYAESHGLKFEALEPAK